MKKTDFVRILSESRLILPPLSGFTDYPYRQILARYRPAFIITEMVNAKAVLMNNKKTMEMLKQVKGDHKNGAQLLGDDPLEMAQAARIMQSLGFDYIDINMGCTVKKVIRKGQGVALMRDQQRACAIVESVSTSVDIPVTVKMRLGYSDSTNDVISFAEQLEESGATALTVHGRSAEKKFSAHIDYEAISAVARSVSLPIIANGGITGKNATYILEKTQATAVMPGRSIIGNPWIIKEAASSLKKASYQEPTLKERKDVAFDHVSLVSDYFGESSGVVRFRKVFPRYFETCKNLKILKTDVKEIHTLSDVHLLLSRIREAEGHIMYG